MSSAARQLIRRHGRWLLALAATIVGVLLCEAAVRILRLAPPVRAIWVDDEDQFYRRSKNPVLGYEIRPSYEREFPAGKASSNSLGMRDVPRTIENPAETRRIILLGDSVVEGISFVDDENTLSQHLERLYANANTEALNFGTSGYCTLAEVELLREKGLAFKPDLVVLLFVMNDFNNFTPELTMEGGLVERPAWSKHLFVGSQLFRLLCLRFNWFDFATETDPSAWNRAAIGENNVVDGFKRLRELANEHKFEVIIIPWPTFRDDDIIQHRHTDSPRPLVERLAAMNGLPVRPLAASFRRAWQELDPQLNPRRYFTVKGDGMHPNAAGAELGARLIHEVIESSRPVHPYQPGPPDAEAIEIARSLSHDGMLPAKNFEQRRYRTLLYNDRNSEAESFLRALLAEDASHPWANLFLGRHLLRVNHQPAESLPFLRTALERDPQHTEARRLVASVLSAQGKGDEAVALLQQGLSLTPYSFGLHYALGSIAITNGQYELADKHLQAAQGLEPNRPELSEMLAQLRSARVKPSP